MNTKTQIVKTILKNGCVLVSIVCLSAFTMVFSRLEKDGFLPEAEFLSKKLLNVTSLRFHWRVYRHTLAEDEPSSDAIAPIIIAAVEKPVATLLS